MADPPAEERGGFDRGTVNPTPSAAELMRQGTEGMDRSEPEEDPWAALGDGAREIAEKKHWESPADMLKAYQAATTRLSQRDEEKEALMAEISRLEQIQQQQPAQQQPQYQNGQQQQGQVAAFDFDALAAQLTDPTTGEINMARALEVAAALGGQMGYQAARHDMQELMSRFEQEKVAPLSQRAEEARMQEELAQLEDRYKEAYADIEARVLDRLKDEPDYVDRLGGLRGAFADSLYDLQQEELAARQREAQAHTLASSARRAPAGPQLDPELAAMERVRWRPDDGLS